MCKNRGMGTLVRDLQRSADLSYLLHVGELWREAAVHAKNFVIDQRRDRQALEREREKAPQRHVISALA